ncbi:hypothetical protein MIR68_011829 [Amoeboaphelidium protococcarum]|nr:hypothetical protein MIR68_011829 [Amoeboaphelidium protococcarum]
MTEGNQQQQKSAAILSVSDKTDLVPFAEGLSKHGVELYASGGTFKCLQQAGIPVKEVSELTQAAEMLGGRVKTLHPAVHGGILARRDMEQDCKDMQDRGFQYIDYVVCNLYPFEKVVAQTGESLSMQTAIEEIDIGGVTLLRAGAKNHNRVTIVTDVKDYDKVLQELTNEGQVSTSLRQTLALKAFERTASYDQHISQFLATRFADSNQLMKLRYGANPHQQNASVYIAGQQLPFKVLNGSPGFINLLDALNSWQLVKELGQSTGICAAASFKHVSPAGVGLGLPLSDDERIVMQVSDISALSLMASAYARARGADRMSSFGDWIALSGRCDLDTAKLIGKEVSDGIIAAGYDAEALEILKKKKGGKYCVLQMDSSYEPANAVDSRDVYGLRLSQSRNGALFSSELVKSFDVLSKCTDINDAAAIDMLVAVIALKYTQSNSVAFAHNGMIVGLGAGQQSRIHCTRLAGSKADFYWLRYHPRVLAMKFKQGIKRADISNAIDLYVSGEVQTMPKDGVEYNEWATKFDEASGSPALLTEAERQDWLNKRRDVVCASDAFFPFPDNVHRAHRSGVKYIIAPTGSVQDKQVISAADEYGMVYAKNPFRLFHH